MNLLLLFLISIPGLAATADVLKVGDVLPSLLGNAASGGQMELPAAGAGAERVLIFSFARAASADSRAWSEHFAKDSSPESPLSDYRVIMLEAVPKLVRGMAVSGIKSGIPKSAWDRTLLVYHDEALWRSRLSVANDSHCYLVVINGDSRVQWLGSGPFSDSAYAQLRQAVGR